MPEANHELRYQFPPRWPSRRRNIITMSRPVGVALPRITRLMALAIQLDTRMRQCPDLDGAELARWGCVSRTRITQILNLVHLAPDIQKRLLWLSPLGK